MPKGKQRRKGASNSSKSAAAAAQNFDLDVDDRSTCYGDDDDAASTCTGISVGMMSDSSAPSCGGGGEVDDIEGKLSACAEMLGEKSSRQRLNAILGLKKILQHSSVPDFVSRYRETLCDGLERSVRKGGGEEKCAAVDVIALLAIQGGDIYREVESTLLKCVKDASCAYKMRAKCCTTLVIAAVLSDDVENDDVSVTVDALQQIFSGSYLKGDASIPVLKPGCDVVYASAIRAWSFLVTCYDVTPSRDVVEKMEDLLHSRELAIRVEGGQAVALLSERGDLNDDKVDQVSRMLRELATDSSKSKSKKEKREQKLVFRDVLASVENDHYYQACIKFGTEALQLDGWSSKIQYDTFKSVLTTGVNLHLARNPTLRQFWSLPPAKLDFDPDDAESAASRKSDRLERQLYREAGRKLQSQARGKKRDKRAAVF